MIKPQEKTENKKVLERLNYSDSQGVGDLVSAISLNGPVEDTSDAFLALNSVTRVMAFVEYGCSGHESRHNYDKEQVFDGVAEIIRACRLVSTRVEDYLFWLSDKEIVEGRESRLSGKTGVGEVKT